MGQITDSFRAKLERGDDPNALRGELLRTRAKIKSDAGFQSAEGASGKWNMGALSAQTQLAKGRNRPTPADQLRDCEIASVHLQFLDMDHPNAQAALQAATNGKIYPSGGFAESAQLELALAKHHTCEARPRSESARPPTVKARVAVAASFTL